MAVGERISAGRQKLAELLAPMVTKVCGRSVGDRGHSCVRPVQERCGRVGECRCEFPPRPGIVGALNEPSLCEAL